MVEELGVAIFAEVGPGSVLTGLIRRIAPGVKTVSLGEPGKMDELLEALQA